MAGDVIIHSSKEYIESKILSLRRKFELIYSSSRDLEKKNSTKKTIDNIERDLKKLRADLFDESDLAKYELKKEDLVDYIESVNKQEPKETKILRNIVPIKLNAFSSNREIDFIWSYLHFFGKEYLGLLSEQNLRLDYGHAAQRDQYFTYYNQIIRVMENYGHLLEELEGAKVNGNREHYDRLAKMQIKEYRDVIMKTGVFLKTIYNFIQDLFESEKGGEKVFLDPDKVIDIQGENSNLNGLTSRQALNDLFMFVDEFIDFLKIPDLKKISENDDNEKNNHSMK